MPRGSSHTWGISIELCPSSKIIHSGGKRSPEDLLTRPHCWKDSGPRLLSKNKTCFFTQALYLFSVSQINRPQKSSPVVGSKTQPLCRSNEAVRNGLTAPPSLGSGAKIMRRPQGLSPMKYWKGIGKCMEKWEIPCTCWFIDGKTVD